MSLTLTPSARQAAAAASALATRCAADPPNEPGNSSTPSSTVSSPPRASTSWPPASTQAVPPVIRWATTTGLSADRLNNRTTGFRARTAGRAASPADRGSSALSTTVPPRWISSATRALMSVRSSVSSIPSQPRWSAVMLVMTATSARS